MVIHDLDDDWGYPHVRKPPCIFHDENMMVNDILLMIMIMIVNTIVIARRIMIILIIVIVIAIVIVMVIVILTTMIMKTLWYISITTINCRYKTQRL